MPPLSDISVGLIGITWQALALCLSLCLLGSALGFKRVQYFVSLGYAASIALQAISLSLLHQDTLRGWALIQVALLLAYGLRLGVFLALREKSSSYQAEQVETE